MMNRNYKKDISGKINFDYSKNNGLFFIGENEYLFGIKVSKGSKTSIHFYNDDPSIKGIALIKDIFNLDNVDFLKDYDMSSRSQSPEIGDSIVLKNKYNKLAALKIMDIKDNTRGGQEVVKRFKTIVTLISYAWKIPSMRKSIIQGINSMNLENCKYDEADIYHTLTYGDYNTRGKTQDERWQIYAEIHGPDITKWPPRVMIKSQTA